MSYHARNCSGWPLSTGQGMKSPPVQHQQAQAATENAATGDVFCAVRWALLIWFIGVMLWCLS